MSQDAFFAQSDHSFEDELIAVSEGDTCCISAAEEQAVDSYNQMFTCSIHLTKEQALNLGLWLMREYGP